CLGHMRNIGAGSIEPLQADEDAWVAHVNDVSTVSLRSTCSSWYVGTNIAGRPRVFMPYIGGFPVYVQKCNEVMNNAYEGFVLKGARSEDVGARPKDASARSEDPRARSEDVGPRVEEVSARVLAKMAYRAEPEG